VDLSQVAGRAHREGEACLVWPPLFWRRRRPCRGAAAWPRAARPGELLLAGQQPFRQLSPPGVTAARQPRLSPLTRRDPIMLT